jgi:ADP-heptose:LPS heptosyltransferase
MEAHNPELFARNQDVDAVVIPDSRNEWLANKWGAAYTAPYYGTWDAETDQETPPNSHIIARMCELCGITGSITIRPYLYLSAGEIAQGKLGKRRQVTIQTSGRGASMPMLNKEWISDRFQEVVDSLANDFAFVQLGASIDPLLSNVTDLRGKTSKRESAAIISQSALFVGLEGFLMHLARSVDTRSVIVYGGRTPPSRNGYTANENIGSSPPCSPCWRYSRCDFDRICMREITSEQVVAAALRQLNRLDTPLPVEVVQVCEDAVASRLSNLQP